MSSGKENEMEGEVAACQGPTKVTPVRLYNRPGLSSIAYRAGTYAEFKSSMLAALALLPRQSALSDLTSRQKDDLAIALLESWATVADVLTFYQERIANEGFIRTAKERRSVKELARMVGYELRPGVAASTYLAFTMEEPSLISSSSSGAVEKTLIAAGTKVQSIPGAGQMPQTFETIEDIEARPEWNKLKARSRTEQVLQGASKVLVFKGTTTMLKPGDLLLVVTPLASSSSSASLPEDGKFGTAARIVASVKTNSTTQTTTVETIGLSNTRFVISPAIIKALKILPPVPRFVELAGKEKLNLIKTMTSARMTESQMGTFARAFGWKKTKLAIAVNFWIRFRPSFNPDIPDWTGAKLPAPTAGVYAFRGKASFFGHNAPKYETLPKEQTGTFGPYPNNWDTNRPNILQNSAGGTNPEHYAYLDNTYQSVVQGSWVIIRGEGDSHAVYRIAKTTEKSLADYAMSLKVTGIQLTDDDLAGSSVNDLDNYKVRDTTAYLQSERLELADLPIETPVSGDNIDLERIVTELKEGQKIAITGDTLLAGEPTGVTESEVAVISRIVHEDSYTTLFLKNNLTNEYRRDTVSINANVAQATHGETKHEALGSGDPSQRLQAFTLKQKPLTFVTSSTTPGGAASTLKVYVNDILWHEGPALHGLGPSDRAYTVRIEGEDDKGYGQTRVIFGDGIHGARPPAGANNIVAVYRAGMGQQGMVKEGQLSLPLTRPLGVKGVSNPVAVTGAADPEVLEHARVNASLPLLAMGRIVSLKDFEDYAQAFAGIGKAQATWSWDGERRIVLLTVAADNGDPLQETSPIFESLVEAIAASKDPAIAVRVKPYNPRMFKVTSRVAVEGDRIKETVLEAVRENLLADFSFDSMGFAQPVALSDVISSIQQVDGVVAADVNYFYPAEDGQPSLRETVNAQTARWRGSDDDDNGAGMVAAELLTIDPDGISLLEMEIAS